MAEDWAVDVKKYAPDADDAVIAGIVNYCGIALRNRDSSLVSFTEPNELARVRENYCRKKLGLTDPDPEIDAAILRVGERMSGDSTKNRVTVYYLLTDAFGKLGLFRGASAPQASGAAAGGSAAAASASATPASASSRAGGPARATPARATAPRGEGTGFGGFAFAVVGVMALIILGTATLGSQIGKSVDPPSEAGAAPQAAAVPQAASAPAAVAPTVAAPAIPDGAGVTAQDVEGKPMVSVYFDTAKADIAPGFAETAAPIKAWIDGNPGARLAVSGFNDSQGNAAFNAELSKNRAKAVAAALADIGVPADAIDLEKPPETTDTGANPAQARRVDIVVKDAG